MGCFLWWLNGEGRGGRRLAWLCWIVSTMAAAGIHTPGLMVLALQPILLIAHPRKSVLRAMMFALGAGIIALNLFLAKPI